MRARAHPADLENGLIKAAAKKRNGTGRDGNFLVGTCREKDNSVPRSDPSLLKITDPGLSVTIDLATISQGPQEAYGVFRYYRPCGYLATISLGMREAYRFLGLNVTKGLYY